ncbi:MAG: hypothetical protein WCE38_02070 [Burkholderiales bacterium]
MKRLALALAAAVLAGCGSYNTEPGAYVSAPPSAMTSLDRSWSAAVGALGDQGVKITYEDRDAGVIQGSRDGIGVVARVRALANGSVRVEFNTSGSTHGDPGLIDRISRAYDARMGR